MYYAVCRIYTPRHSVHLGYPCISVYAPPRVKDVLGGCDRACLEMHLATEIPVNSEILLETGIESVWGCTWRPRDLVNSEIQLEAIIE